MLALLAVTARSRLLPVSPGIIAGIVGGACGGTGGSCLDLFPRPREKVRAEFRKNPGRAEGGGGTGMSLNVCTFLSDLASIEDGFVEMLSRVEDAPLS